MDYSLLIGQIRSDQIQKAKQMVAQNPTLGNSLKFTTNGNAYILGIIDPLTFFGKKKQAEYMIKVVKSGAGGASCVPPE